MASWSALGKMLILIGLVLVVLGIVLQFFPKLPLGKLPGDIIWERKGLKVYFPWVSCLVISILISLILYFWNR